MVNARRVWLGWIWCAATIALSGARLAAWQGDLFPPELVSFAPEPVEPVFQGAGAGQWDQHIRERGWILREGDLYRMWYTGYDDAHRAMKLGYATSKDGVHWTRHAKNPIYDAHWVEDMMVVRQGDTYYMFAEGERDRAQLLTSPDGITWTRVGQLDVRKKNGQPIDPGPYGTPTAWLEDGVWYLFYERRDLGIWLATSRDLAVWTNVQDEPVIPLGPEEYDREQVALNQIVKHQGRYYAYYHGAGPVRGGRRLWCTSVATSRDLVHWEKYPQNPLFPVEENKSSGILVHDGQRYLLYTMHAQVQRHVPQQPVPPPAARSQGATVLGIRGTQFTLNGRPTFLLGLSYYGGLGAAEATIRRDLEDAQKYGFHWIRVWATWAAFGQDVSAVDDQGRPRTPYLEKLQWLVAECDRRGIVVDVTLSRGNGVSGPARLQSLEAHRRAVQTLVAALAVSLAFPSVRAIANSFLQLFRVEQVRVISVNMDALPGRMESSAQLEAFFSKNVQIEEQGEPQEVATLEEASALAGMPLRELPGEPAQYLYQPGGAATITIDLELLRGVLREMGRSDVQLPDSLDGAVVKVQIPDSVITQVGDCQSSQRAGVAEPGQGSPNQSSDCVIFFQMPSPSVSAPPELDVAQLGQIYLQVLGMSETEAAQFASKVDWTTTFVIPIPQGSADYKEVQVDGVTGALLQFRRGSGPGYMLIWVKNGVVYVLSGFGNKNAALEAAAALK